MKFGEYVRSKRQEAGLTQKQLAKKLGYTSPQFVSNWERMTSFPPVKSLKKICKIIGADLEETKGRFYVSKIVSVDKAVRKQLWG